MAKLTKKVHPIKCRGAAILPSAKLFNGAKILEFLIAVVFVLMGVVFRIIPHAPNFTPIAAIALFGAVYLPRKTAFVLPIAAMLISDMFIGFYEPQIMVIVYGSFILTGFLGLWLKNHKRPQTLFFCSLFSSLTFFILTNFAVFAFTPWYPKTFLGLAQCYSMALPFFRNTLLGDLFYTSVFFGAYELVKILVAKKFTVVSYESFNY